MYCSAQEEVRRVGEAKGQCVGLLDERRQKSADSVGSKARVEGHRSMRDTHGSEVGRGLVRGQRDVTNRHEGLRIDTGLGHPDGVDSKDPHLVQDALDHLGGLVGCVREDLEVQLHPALRALLLPLQEVPCMPPSRDEWAVMGRPWRGSQVSRGSEGPITKPRDPERPEAMNLGLI